MKLAPLLAQYLYSHKRLDLPGLGTFFIDPSANSEAEHSKGKTGGLEGVSFESNPSLKDTPDLIQFISSQTGKIKALASADLESYLELAQQFLNIGKPFLLDGIGNLEKIRSGEFAFTPGQALPASMKELPVKEVSATLPEKEYVGDYKSVFYLRKTKAKWKKPLTVFLLLAGLAFAIWGGYTVYKRTTAKNRKAPVEEKKDETVLVEDSPRHQQDTTLHQKDNVIAPNQAPVSLAAGNYKFIIETAAKERALSRFARLKSFGLDIKMETRDSASFKLFFILPATVADTARMIDSLRGIYTPAGNRAFVEN